MELVLVLQLLASPLHLDASYYIMLSAPSIKAVPLGVSVMVQIGLTSFSFNQGLILVIFMLSILSIDVDSAQKRSYE